MKDKTQAAAGTMEGTYPQAIAERIPGKIEALAERITACLETAAMQRNSLIEIAGNHLGHGDVPENEAFCDENKDGTIAGAEYQIDRLTCMQADIQHQIDRLLEL